MFLLWAYALASSKESRKSLRQSSAFGGMYAVARMKDLRPRYTAHQIESNVFFLEIMNFAAASVFRQWEGNSLWFFLPSKKYHQKFLYNKITRLLGIQNVKSGISSVRVTISWHCNKTVRTVENAIKYWMPILESASTNFYTEISSPTEAHWTHMFQGLRKKWLALFWGEMSPRVVGVS